MRILFSLAALVVVAGCGSMPLPAGWVSQDTVQQRNLDALAEKIIAKITPAEPVNFCSALRAPGKFARPVEVSSYYIVMAGCLASAEPPPPSELVGALGDIEESRRAILRGSGDRARIVADSLLGIARLGVDLDIASKDRESRERISDAENSGGSASPSVSVGGDYIIGDGNSGATSSTSSSVDNRVDNRTSEVPAPSTGSASPVIDDVHARCHYEAEDDADRVACNVTYQNSERRVVYGRCSASGWSHDSDECVKRLSDRDVWAARMGLRWNSDRQTYEIIPQESREVPGA